MNPLDKTLHEQVIKYLDTVRKELGDNEWQSAVTKQVTQAFRMGGNYEDFWREQLKDPKYSFIDPELLKKQAAAQPAPAMDINNVLAQTFKARMPGMKTQAQFTAFRTTFDAFEATCNAIFSADAEKEEECRKLLDQTFLACRQATEISRKLEDVPEAATSKAAEEFKKPPAEFVEYDVQQELLGELGTIEDFHALQEWYVKTKLRRDAVKSQSLRNVLMDAIRSRRIALGPSETPKAPQGS